MSLQSRKKYDLGESKINSNYLQDAIVIMLVCPTVISARICMVAQQLRPITVLGVLFQINECNQMMCHSKNPNHVSSIHDMRLICDSVLLLIICCGRIYLA